MIWGMIKLRYLYVSLCDFRFSRYLRSFPQQLGQSHHVGFKLSLVRPLSAHFQAGIVRGLGDEGPAIPAAPAQHRVRGILQVSSAAPHLHSADRTSIRLEEKKLPASFAVLCETLLLYKRPATKQTQCVIWDTAFSVQTDVFTGNFLFRACISCNEVRTHIWNCGRLSEGSVSARSSSLQADR